MTSDCSTTANAISEVLLAGDVVLNLTQQPLNTISGTLFVHADAGQLLARQSAASIIWQHSYLFSLWNIVSGRVSRLVIVSDEDCSDADFIARELVARNIPNLHCSLMNACESDAFMDEQDAEAVTERLRQLGYI